jgi:hypothetical protein
VVASSCACATRSVARRTSWRRLYVRPHMTSPPPETQLVLELKVGVLDAEFIEVLPGSGLRRLAAPMDQYLTNPTRQASLLDTQRFWNHRAVVDGWQSWWQGRRCVDELLEHANIEHIMKSGTQGQFQANSDIVDDLNDMIGSHKLGLQLPVVVLGMEDAARYRSQRSAQSPT